MSFWKTRPKEGAFSRIDRSARIAFDVEIGAWTEVEAGVRIGQGTKLGNWSQVGEGSCIGQDVLFGSWAKVGRNVMLGDGVRLGSHTIVQDGVTVPAGAVFQDCDLVTPQGIVPDRTGGFVMGLNGTNFEISGSFGKFQIPMPSRSLLSEQDIENAHRIFRKKIEEFQWGRSDALEAFRVIPEPEAASDPEPSF